MLDSTTMAELQLPAGTPNPCAVEKLRDTQNGHPRNAQPLVEDGNDTSEQDEVLTRLRAAFTGGGGAVQTWIGNSPPKMGIINCPEFAPRLTYARINETSQAPRIMDDRPLQEEVAGLVNEACSSLPHCELAIVFYADTLPHKRPPDLPAAVFSCVENKEREADLLASLMKASETNFSFRRLKTNKVVIGLSEYTFPLRYGRILIPEGRSAAGDRINGQLRQAKRTLASR